MKALLHFAHLLSPNDQPQIYTYMYTYTHKYTNASKGITLHTTRQ